MSRIEATDKNVKFPAQHYVNFQSRPSQDNTPLGFMTPHGTDAAAKKRIASVDAWAKTYDHHTKSYTQNEGVTYDNKPMVGFKLAREVRRYASFGSGNVKWRIEDPRGFELEISSPNFAQILLLCTVERGEIQEQMIWGRLGSENVLVPVNSEVYEAAQANTARVAKKASLRDLGVGDHVVLHNGDEGTFLGAFYFYKGHGDARSFGLKGLPNKRYVFRRKGKASDTRQLFAIASPKVSEITKAEIPGSIEVNEREINEGLQKAKDRYYLQDNSTDYSTVYAVTTAKPEDHDITITREVVQFADLLTGKLDLMSDAGFFEDAHGRTWGFDVSYFLDAAGVKKKSAYGFGRGGEFHLYKYDGGDLKEGKLTPIMEARRYYGGSEYQVSMTAKVGSQPSAFELLGFRVKTQHGGELTLKMYRG